MAITRCPYCHAIIDENDKYCNNCGTQLLFADDEEIEEEIPGEKIVDAPVEEKDYTVDEPEDEKRPKAAKDLESEIDEELREETEEMALDELIAEDAGEDDEGDVTEEVILVDELAASEAAAKDGSRVLEGAPPAGAGAAVPVAAEDDEEDEGDEEEKEEEEEETDEDEDDEEDEEDEEEEEEKEEDEEEKEEEKAEEKRKDDSDRDEEDEEDKDTEEDEEDELGEEELADELEEEEEEEEEPGPAPHKDEETREYDAAVRKGPAVVEEPVGPAVDGEEFEVEYVVGAVPPDESATAGEASLRPATFDSAELDNLGKTVELSKQRVDKFLEVIGERTVVTPPAPPPPVSPSSPPAPAVPTPELTPVPRTGSLPPWASMMKGAPVFDNETGPVETRKLRGGEPAAADTADEVEIFPKRPHADSTIGLPERISQAPLPFESPTPDEEDAEDAGEVEAAGDAVGRDLTPEAVVPPAGPARPAREPVLPVREPGPAAPGRTEAESRDETEEPAERPPFSFSVFFKSKTFDILFVGLFWLVALWLAASSMGVTLFAILGEMSGSMLLLYAVFMALYFFLFKFFLGETLGDRLFRPRE